MRIAILADPLDNQNAGIHIYTNELVKALIEYDNENEYILIRESKDHNLNIRQVAVPNIRLPIGFASLRLFFIIPFLLRFLKVDAVFETAHFGPFNLPKQVKRITMIHDLTPILFPKYHRFHSQILQRLFLKRILKKADLILSNSENTTRDIKRVYPFTKPKVSTIHLGKENIYKPDQSRHYLDTIGISNPYFISVGTIDPRKNGVLLLDAFEKFKIKYSNSIQLLIVGEKGWKSRPFFQKLENHPFRKEIILAGYVDKKYLPQLYTHSLALIYPSLYEGFGLPVLEAMSCGTLVICSNSSSLPEVGGEAAFFLDCKKPVESEISELSDPLANLMAEVAGLPDKDRTQKIQLGKEQASHFSWKKYVLSFMERIRDLN